MQNAKPKPEDLIYLCGGEIDQGRFELSIWGDALDPEEITKLLGISPTDSYRKGDVNSKGRIKNHGSWSFDTEKISFRSGTSCEDAFLEYLKRLPGSTDLWRDLNRRFKCRVTMVLYMQTWNREFDISTEAMQELVSKNLSLHIDTYLESQDEDAEI
jgi:hypothetical protein